MVDSFWYTQTWAKYYNTKDNTFLPRRLAQKANVLKSNCFHFLNIFRSTFKALVIKDNCIIGPCDMS
jgi:hypothetical protein